MIIEKDLKRYKLKTDASGKLYDPIRQIYVPATPEEKVRQRMIKYLISRMKVPSEKIVVEQGLVKFGVEDQCNRKKRIDIGFYGNYNELAAIIECKAYSIQNVEAPYQQAIDYVRNLKIPAYHADASKENLIAVLDAIRTRMHADGHFIVPVITDEEDDSQFAFRSIQTKDGKMWHAVFTSQAEFEKGEPSQVLSHFIDSMLKACVDTGAEGFIINPWGQSFMLAKELIEMIFKADGDVEYSVPDDKITPELLEGGAFLKRATEICNRNRTQLNLIKLAKILRDSWVWVPCNAIMSDADYEAFEKMVLAAKDGEGLDSLVGQNFVAHDETRMVPDILQNGDDFFFPVFTSDTEMGEYGEQFSKMERHFMEAMILARNNEKNVKGIVINAFSEPFVVPREMFDIIAGMDSSSEPKEGEDNE